MSAAPRLPGEDAATDATCTVVGVRLRIVCLSAVVSCEVDLLSITARWWFRNYFCRPTSAFACLSPFPINNQLMVSVYLIPLLIAA